MYIGKIEENLCVWLEEHASDKESSDFWHNVDCANYQLINNLYCINRNLFDTCMYDKNSIQENRNIIDSARNWNVLLIKKRCI